MNEANTTILHTGLPLAGGSLPQQCGRCQRYFRWRAASGDWETVILSIPEQSARMRALLDVDDSPRPAWTCEDEECSAFAQKIEEKQRLEVKLASQRVQAARRNKGKKDPAAGCRSARNGFRSSTEPTNARQPYKESERVLENVSQLPAVAHRLSQEEFVASGKAETGIAKLAEFFDWALVNGLAGKRFSRVFLKTKTAPDDMVHNRVGDLRPAYAARGIKIVNEDWSADELTRKTSHYRLLVMSDAECEKFKVTGVAPLE